MDNDAWGIMNGEYGELACLNEVRAKIKQKQNIKRDVLLRDQFIK